MLMKSKPLVIARTLILVFFFPNYSYLLQRKIPKVEIMDMYYLRRRRRRRRRRR